MSKKHIDPTEPISEISFGGEVLIKAKKMYFIHDDALIEKIDFVINEYNFFKSNNQNFNNGNIQTLDGENGPGNPPRPPKP